MIATYYLILVCEQALQSKKGKEKERRKRTHSPSVNSLLASSLSAIPAAVRRFHPKPVTRLIQYSPFGHAGPFFCVFVAMQKVLFMALLSTTASMWKLSDFLLLGSVSSVSWNLQPVSHSGAFDRGQPKLGRGRPYVPFGQVGPTSKIQVWWSI